MAVTPAGITQGKVKLRPTSCSAPSCRPRHRSAWLRVTRESTSLACETSPVRATAHLGSNRPRWTSRCPSLSPVRIESAFIADHVEVDPTTRTLDVRTGFQSYVKVPNLPFRHVLGLAIVFRSPSTSTTTRSVLRSTSSASTTYR